MAGEGELKQARVERKIMSDGVFDEDSVVECASGEICKTLTAMELVRRKCLRGIIDERGGYCEQYYATGKGDQPQRSTAIRASIRKHMPPEYLSNCTLRYYLRLLSTTCTSSSRS